MKLTRRQMLAGSVGAAILAANFNAHGSPGPAKAGQRKPKLRRLVRRRVWAVPDFMPLQQNMTNWMLPCFVAVSSYPDDVVEKFVLRRDPDTDTRRVPFEHALEPMGDDLTFVIELQAGKWGQALKWSEMQRPGQYLHIGLNSERQLSYVELFTFIEFDYSVKHQYGPVARCSMDAKKLFDRMKDVHVSGTTAGA